MFSLFLTSQNGSGKLHFGGVKMKNKLSISGSGGRIIKTNVDIGGFAIKRGQSQFSTFSRVYKQ
jgi:hypothetical protein